MYSPRSSYINVSTSKDNKRVFMRVFKKILLVSCVSMFLCQGVQAGDDLDVSNEGEGLGTAQKWVLGITGAILLASSQATHKTSAQEGRKTVVLIGLVAFIGATVYENSRNEKIEFGLKQDAPTIVFSKSF